MLGMPTGERKPVSLNKPNILRTRKLKCLLQNKVDIYAGTKKNREPDCLGSFPEPKNGGKQHNIENIVTQQRDKPHKVKDSRMVQILEEINNLQDYWSLAPNNKFLMAR
jgi:hypothetical protein